MRVRSAQVSRVLALALLAGPLRLPAATATATAAPAPRAAVDPGVPTTVRASTAC